jgi:two-component system, NarL family, sensor histidine kinase UhpB
VRSRRTSKVRTEPSEDLSRQLLNAQEEERRRISRELHDETGQGLMVLRFQLEMLAGDAKGQEGKAKIQESLELLDRTIEGLRRTIARLSPRVLEELGLLAGIRREAQLVSRHTGIAGDLQVPEEIQPLSRELEVAIYRSVQEALHNIAKHSRASHFSVRLDVASSKVTVLVEDDGVGFSPRTARDRGFGLEGMRERAAALGGSVTVRSGQEKGTRIRLVFPIESARNVNPAALENSLHRVNAA